MTAYKTEQFPGTRIATIDIFGAGKKKHHITALLEVDVSLGREKIQNSRAAGRPVSFTAWLISVISQTIKKHETAAAYLEGKNKLVIFNDINVSLIVEKELKGKKVPVPLVIEKANEKNAAEITQLIEAAKTEPFTEEAIVLHKKASRMERRYYALPGFLRRLFWKYLLAHPRFAFAKMGNVGITSVGMMGNVNGWFIPVSIHPVCFGISSVVKKPVVAGDQVLPREMLNMTVLLDHDVIDGAPMARFVTELVKNLENGMGL